MTFEYGRDWHFVKIKVTAENLKSFFTNGEKHFKVSKGIPSHYDDFYVVGVIQDSSSAVFSILLRRGDVPEGMVARPINPEIERIQDDKED